MSVDPRREELRESNVLRKMRANGLRPERSQNHPEFQRSESAAELNAGVHQIPAGGVSLIAGKNEFRREGKRRSERVHTPAVQDTEIDGCEQPFVRVDD